MWEAIKYVSSGLTLVAFVVAAIVSWQVRQSKHNASVLKQARREDLPAILANQQEFIPVDTAGMSDEEKRIIALRNIQAKETRDRERAIVGVVFAVLLFALALVAILRPAPAPIPEPSPQMAKLRLVVTSLTFGIQNSEPYVVGNMSLTASDRSFLVNIIRVGVIATSKSDASVLAASFDPLMNKSLQRGEIVAVAIPRGALVEWRQMGKPTTLAPSFATHYFAFIINLRAIEADSGKSLVIDLNVPRPATMKCDHECIAVYDLNVSGPPGYSDCTAAALTPVFDVKCGYRRDI